MDGILIKTNVKMMRVLVGYIRPFVDEVRVVFEPDSMNIKFVDPAHVMMGDLKIPYGFFDEYKCGKTIELGVDIDTLHNAIKGHSVKETVSMAFLERDDGEPWDFQISVNGVMETHKTVETGSMSDPKIPKLNLPNGFEVPAKDLFGVLKNAKNVSDYIRIYSCPKGVSMWADNDVGEKIRWHKDEDFPMVKEGLKSAYSLDYITNIIKGIQKETLSIDMGEDFPIRIKFAYGEYLLAPRITTDYEDWELTVYDPWNDSPETAPEPPVSPPEPETAPEPHLDPMGETEVPHGPFEGDDSGIDKEPGELEFERLFAMVKNHVDGLGISDPMERVKVELEYMDKLINNLPIERRPKVVVEY